MPLRILVIDDDTDTLDVLVRLLRSCDHSVDGCSSAETALTHVTNASYDVLLTDLIMPVRSGLELIDDAHRMRPEIRAIVMSGYARTADVSPDIGWVSKPIDVDLLLTALE